MNMFSKILGAAFTIILMANDGSATEGVSKSTSTASNTDKQQTQEAPHNAKTTTFPEIEDIVLGHDDAKIALVEYSAINCTHCAAFRKEFSEPFHKKFIDTHKVQLVFKHFPLDYAAVEYMSLIVKQPKDKWLELFNKALEHQKEWLGKKPEVLAKILGISKADCQSALNCQLTKQMVMAKRFNAEQVLEINATPTFLIIYRLNGKVKSELINEGISPNDLLAKLDQIYTKL